MRPEDRLASASTASRSTPAGSPPKTAIHGVPARAGRRTVRRGRVHRRHHHRPERHGQRTRSSLIVQEAFSSTLVNGQRVRVDLNQVGMWFADPADDDFCLGADQPGHPVRRRQRGRRAGLQLGQHHAAARSVAAHDQPSGPRPWVRTAQLSRPIQPLTHARQVPARPGEPFARTAAPLTTPHVLRSGAFGREGSTPPPALEASLDRGSRARCPQRAASRAGATRQLRSDSAGARVRTGPAHGREEQKDAPMTLVPGR